MNTLANALGAVRSERPIRHATPDEDQGLSAVTAAAGRELRQRVVSELARRSKAGPAAGLVASRISKWPAGPWHAEVGSDSGSRVL